MAVKRRYRELAVILPLGGTILFMPPYLRILSRHEFLFGVPLMHLYIFGAWLLGILLTALLARRLSPGATGDRSDPDARNSDPRGDRG
jgi:hypothetical protein